MASSFAIFALALCIGAVRGIDNPIITANPRPVSVVGDLWTFQEIRQIKLTCSHPKGKAVHWGPITALEVNQILGKASFSNVSNAHVKPTQMTISYNATFFDKMLKISCYSTDATPRRNTTALRIEQKYRTKNVRINNGSRNVTVKPTRNPVLVQLQCFADGNPSPYFGSWYNSSSKGVMTIHTNPPNKFTFYYLNSTKFKYQCEARNAFNSGFERSAWVEVNGSNKVKSAWSFYSYLPFV